MDVLITPSHLKGKITAPPSKSISHRAIICAALANGRSVISPIDFSEDINSTILAARAIGAEIIINKNELIINGISSPPKTALIDCSESGSTLRFFIPISAALGIKSTFSGRGRLPQRPLNAYLNCLNINNAKFEYSNTLPAYINGQLKSGIFEISGDISSQFITGLLFALPLLGGDSKIVLTSPLESRGYIDLTIDTLSEFGIKIDTLDDGFYVYGGQKYQPKDFTVEGDFSNAAFYLCANYFGSDILFSGLNKNSKQGDMAIVDILHDLLIKKNNINLKIDVAQIPDLVPILAIAAALTTGKTTICNAARLRIKESDRLFAIADGLRNLGADIVEQQDTLIINGKSLLQGGEVQSYNDHRIAMALAIASIKCENDVLIKNAQCINKSYPDFFLDFKNLGGILSIIS